MKILHSQVNQSVNILKKKQLPSLVSPLFEFWSQDCENHLGMMSPCTLVLKTGHTPQVSLSHTHNGLQHQSISMSFSATAFLITLCC